MKKILLCIICVCLLTACAAGENSTSPTAADSSSLPACVPADYSPLPSDSPEKNPELDEEQYIDPNGETIEQRILLPEGYTRTRTNGFGEFLRNQPLEPDKSPVKLYDGTIKQSENHVAVLSMDVGEKNRQQCVDAAIRLRAEYLFSIGEYDKINFHLTNGDTFPYVKYRNGYRLIVKNNKTSLKKTAGYDASYKTFRKYCDILFAYAGSMSLEAESKPIKEKDMQIGDIFIRGGSPGHCVIVVDMCEKDGEKQFLIAQSYMPAQQIHILKNPDGDSPWYKLSEITYPFSTPSWTFEKDSLMRMP